MMKRIGTTLALLAGIWLAASTSLIQPVSLLAQDKLGSIHGHVNNAAGQPIKGATVRLTTDQSTDPKTVKWAYTFPVEDSGDYKGSGIAPNTYIAVVVVDNKTIDGFPNTSIKAGEDLLLNFDMTRKEFMDKLTPEERKQIEEFKKKNAEAVANNSKVANLNNLLKQARDDNKGGNFQAAFDAMTQATQQAPNEAILWVTMGDAQLGLADTALKAAKAAGQKTNDPALMQKFSDAAASYKKAVDLNAALPKPNPQTAAAAYNQMGQAYGRSGNVKDAADAYDNAAKADPTKAGMYYFNEAATLYNAGKVTEAGAAADKAIAADPTKAEAYYIKGQALIPGATVDPKTQKITAPPGCVDAYQKYLELAPTGAHAQEVQSILEGIGEKVKSSYKAKK